MHTIREQIKRCLSFVAKALIFASPSGQLRVRQEAINTIEQNSSTAKQHKGCLLDTLSQTRAERLHQQLCNLNAGEPKSPKTAKTSKNSKPSGKGSKRVTNRKTKAVK